jgi:hypothetical protein
MARNNFTAPKRLDDGSRGDLRTHCEKFQMTAVDERDMVFLSHLYRTIFLHGGKVIVDDGQTKQTYKFGC